MKTTKRFPRGLFTLGLFLVGVPAAALYGGAQGTGWYLGPLPSNWFNSNVYGVEPCFTDTIETDVRDTVREVRINPAGVANDGDPNTYLKCTDFANQNTLVCQAGFPDGTVVKCGDINGPKRGPGPTDRVYMLVEENAPQNGCDIVIESVYGESNPACRTSGTGGSTGTGGSMGTGGVVATGGSSGSACNASTAAAVLSTGQSTTVASNACVQLRIDPTWSTVDPNIQAQPGTSAYPVPYTATSCKGTSSGTLVGDWDQDWLIDGQGATTNFGCDVFVKLQGTGTAVKFVYYN